jgi:hypothetical protein
MGELSDRFGELMARLAKSDADLFRTVGAQNASLRQQVEDLAPPAVAPSAPPPAALAPAALLPPEACDLKALKLRFGKLADAQAWLEGQIGPAPKKPPWAVIAQTCRSGAWPVSASRSAAAPKCLTSGELEERLTALEQRLEQRLEQQLEQRFNRLEGLLTLLLTALEKPSGPPAVGSSPLHSDSGV